jgi:hypothetical protein
LGGLIRSQVAPLIAPHVSRREAVRQLALPYLVRQGLRGPQAVIGEQPVTAPRVGFEVFAPCCRPQRRFRRHRSPLPGRRTLDEVKDQCQRREQLVELRQVLRDNWASLVGTAPVMVARPFDEDFLRRFIEGKIRKLDEAIGRTGKWVHTIRAIRGLPLLRRRGLR